MTHKFKAGDKVVALKGFHTIKVGDILTVDNITDCWFQAVECRGFTLNAANYELYKPEFKNMKFRVNSPEQSKEIQEALFEMGYKVYGNLPTNINYIYTHASGSEIRCGYEESTFQDYEEHQEHTVETTKSYKLIPVESSKETITIDGKTYDKEAVLKHLAELEEVK